MVTVTNVPLFVTVLFRGMPGMWKSRHRLMLGWLVVMQALFPGRKTLEELAHRTPGPDYGGALSLPAEGSLLDCPSTGRMVDPGSPEHLAIAPRWHPLSRG
jgi:hypothetical protein